MVHLWDFLCFIATFLYNLFLFKSDGGGGMMRMGDRRDEVEELNREGGV